MKKGLIVMLGLMAVAFLSACDKPVVDNPQVDVNNPEINENINETENTEVENTENYGNPSLNNEELDELEHVMLPVSYMYEKYSLASEWLVDSGESPYSEGDPLLLDITSMISREVQSSSVQDGMIYTNTIVTLEDGSQYSVLYVNDPVTLQFVAASISDNETTSLYTFKY